MSLVLSVLNRQTYMKRYIYIPVLFFLWSCQQSPSVDRVLFFPGNPPPRPIEELADSTQVMKGLEKLPGDAARVDSLLSYAYFLESHKPNLALTFAEQAYEISTRKGWDLQRGISLYFVSLLKRRLHQWGGGIEDALADAELSRIIFERLDRKDWLVRIYDLIGIIHQRQNEVDRPMKRDTARSYFQRSQKVLETAGLPEEDSIALIGEILHDLGTTYEVENPDEAEKFYVEALENYREVGNEEGIARIWNALGLLWSQDKMDKADSVLSLAEHYTQSHSQLFLLAETYDFQHRLLLNRYKQNRDPVIFEEMIGILNNRLRLQPDHQYHTYEKLGITYQSKAVKYYLQSRKASEKDSSSKYFDLAYTYLDTVLNYYKIAMDEAQNKGVLQVMDQLTHEILVNCMDKVKEGKGDCEEIFGEKVSQYLARGYKTVSDQTTANLVQANQRVRELTRIEGERVASRKRRELTWIGIGLIIISSLVFLLFLQRSEQRKLRAKMEALRAQISPHFVSNSLNAIENLVNKGENEAAAKYLIHFSRLSRKILNGSRYPEVPLKEELQTLTHFLNLEQLRFRDKLQFQFEVEERLEQERILVPSMILQPYVENAIWHGIKPKEGMGKLIIRVKEESRYLRCEVEDDGIGRKNSQALNSQRNPHRVSHGMAITEERLKTVGKAKGSKVEVEDLYTESGQGSGTLVVIRIPLKYKKAVAAKLEER